MGAFDARIAPQPSAAAMVRAPTREPSGQGPSFALEVNENKEYSGLLNPTTAAAPLTEMALAAAASQPDVPPRATGARAARRPLT